MQEQQRLAGTRLEDAGAHGRVGELDAPALGGDAVLREQALLRVLEL